MRSQTQRSVHRPFIAVVLGFAVALALGVLPSLAAESPAISPLGRGDQVSVQVYGQPEMGTSVNVGDDGTISVPLVGAVQVAGLSPVDAARRVEQALRDGQYLVDPHVTIALLQSLSQRVDVLGEVRNPGRYVLDPHGTVLDLLAQAGGVTEAGADVIYILRNDPEGQVARYPVDIKGFSSRPDNLPTLRLQGGDSVLVPKAPQFYIYGEIANPNKYRLESGLTVIEAVARAGGITPRGSERRIEIKRLGKDGKYVISKARPSDPVQPDDVIRVKESIF